MDRGDFSGPAAAEDPFAVMTRPCARIFHQRFSGSANRLASRVRCNQAGIDSCGRRPVCRWLPAWIPHRTVPHCSIGRNRWPCHWSRLETTGFARRWQKFLHNCSGVLRCTPTGPDRHLTVRHQDPDPGRVRLPTPCRCASQPAAADTSRREMKPVQARELLLHQPVDAMQSIQKCRASCDHGARSFQPDVWGAYPSLKLPGSPASIAPGVSQ